MKRTLSLLLATLIALPAQADDAGVADAGAVDAPLALSVESADLVLDDGLQTPVHVDGGAWLNEALLLQLAREKASLKAENAALKQAPPATPWAVVLGIGLGVLGGLAGGISLGVQGCRLAGCR